MSKKLISSGSLYEAQMSYSRAVVAAPFIFVSGTTGFNYATMTIADDIVAQTEQTFLNIENALQQAGASLQDVVQVRYILPDAALFTLCQPVLQKYFGNVKPAATLMQAGLLDQRMLIEIEVVAAIPV
ncbi:MAG: RidA family protein [Sphingobacteriales bacterium]|uniref:RidA family protein n=1 Tax=Hydrotalea flava TaxID=714549 RepID=UPI00082C33A7|nr:RidA family protein [Hydrotalea flava]RTL47636.1 MAG: RidA family protein [Sphingobacteriales bacterium]